MAKKHKNTKQLTSGTSLLIIIGLVAFTAFIWSGCLAPTSNLGQSANNTKCGIYNASGIYPNQDAKEECQ